MPWGESKALGDPPVMPACWAGCSLERIADLHAVIVHARIVRAKVAIRNMVPGDERRPPLGQSVSAGQASVKEDPASEGVFVRYRRGSRIAVVDGAAEHWFEKELREDVERPHDARIPITRLSPGIDHGAKLRPRHEEFILLGQVVR